MVKKILHFSLFLAMICAVCIFGVSMVYSLTFEAIEAKEMAKKQAALDIILRGLEVKPQPDTFVYPTGDGKEQYTIYLGADPKTQRTKGWGLQVGEQGYSSVVQTMVGIDEDYKVIAIEIVFQQETPGLGAECVSTGPKKISELWQSEKQIVAKRPWFQEQFANRPADKLVVKTDIKIISGATITSAAVVRSVQKAIAIVKSYRQKKSTAK